MPFAFDLARTGVTRFLPRYARWIDDTDDYCDKANAKTAPLSLDQLWVEIEAVEALQSRLRKIEADDSRGDDPRPLQQRMAQLEAISARERRLKATEKSLQVRIAAIQAPKLPSSPRKAKPATVRPVVQKPAPKPTRATDDRRWGWLGAGGGRGL